MTTKKVRNPLIILTACAFMGACSQSEFSELSPEAQIGLGLLGALLIYKAVEHPP